MDNGKRKNANSRDTLRCVKGSSSLRRSSRKRKQINYREDSFPRQYSGESTHHLKKPSTSRPISIDADPLNVRTFLFLILICSEIN